MNNENILKEKVNKKHTKLNEYLLGLLIGLIFGYFGYLIIDKHTGNKGVVKGLRRGICLNLFIFLISINVLWFLISYKLSSENKFYRNFSLKHRSRILPQIFHN